jgi:rod shape determining protein RodA
MAVMETLRRSTASSPSGLGNIRRSMAEPSRNIDWLLMFAVAGLSTIGAFAVYSTTRPRLLARGVDPYYLLQRQIAYIIAAAVAMVIQIGRAHV